MRSLLNLQKSIYHIISFILLFAILSVFINPDKVEATSSVDQRFGVGGFCGRTESLGINSEWSYTWGNTGKDDNGFINLYNSDELSCLTRNPNNKVLFTLGKVSWNAEGVDQDDVDHWLEKAKKDGYWSSKDQKQFEEIIDISNTKNIPAGRFRAPHRMQVGYIQIPYLLNQKKGGYVQIANEPDINLFIPPTMYATYYHNYYERIKRYDPTTKVTVGSLGYPDYNHEFKNVENHAAITSNYPKLIEYSGDSNEYPMYEKIKEVPSDKKEIYRSGGWLIDCSIKYKRKYGTNIPVDFWAIHPYPWATQEVTNPNSGYVGRKFSNPDDAVADSIRQLEVFNKIIALPEINQSKKPIWVTEYSILNHKVITKSIFLRDQNAFQSKYMEKFVQQAISEKLAHKFFYFFVSNPTLNNKTLISADRNKIGDPISFDLVKQPYPTNIQLPNSENINQKSYNDFMSNKHRMGEYTAFNFFHMHFRDKYTIQLMTENYHIFSLDYPDSEKAISSNANWNYLPPEKWAQGIDKSDKIQAFNTYWDPIKNKMVQQVIADGNAWSREASCKSNGCDWPKVWSNWGQFMENTPGAAGKDILGFDTRVMKYPNDIFVKQQTVMVEGNHTYTRVNKKDDKGVRRWTSWQSRGVWKPYRSTEAEIILDIYGSNPYKSTETYQDNKGNPYKLSKQHQLEMFTYDPIRKSYYFYSWEPKGTSYLMSYTDGRDTTLLYKYKLMTNTYADNSAPYINDVKIQQYNRNSNKITFKVKTSDKGSGVVSYKYGVGSSRGWNFNIVSEAEFLSTSNEVTIDLSSSSLNQAGAQYLNVFAEDAYGNISGINSVKVY